MYDIRLACPFLFCFYLLSFVFVFAFVFVLKTKRDCCPIREKSSGQSARSSLQPLWAPFRSESFKMGLKHPKWGSNLWHGSQRKHWKMLLTCRPTKGGSYKRDPNNLIAFTPFQSFCKCGHDLKQCWWVHQPPKVNKLTLSKYYQSMSEIWSQWYEQPQQV